ncbi:hypothetical protein CLIB1444_01S07668 [[Candida] jaroonii]|uniref:Uncharacterized protein n=1 Tax=[Candida] jaroonii TaxID=467808 RepID=A0ACA9Y0T8_9ASCO|nr:hypothetical protein CLIB1444_01S07668 [[Candida] jaroonii]
MDDILKSSPYDYNKARSRSQSPNKSNRKSLPPGFEMKLPSLPYVYSDDLKSMSSNSSSNNSGSSVASEKLKELSKSPISKKLHINTIGDGHHVIPIPFTINLPPKLSPKNRKPRSPSPDRNSRSPSPSKSKPKRSKLVFTGVSYEKIDNSSSEDEVDIEKQQNDHITQIELAKRRLREMESRDDSKNFASKPSSASYSLQSPPSSPKKTGPPSVNSNKRKSAKSTIQARQLNQDELSIIEEQSQSGSNNSSRTSSLRDKSEDKSLPSAPMEQIIEIQPPLSPERGRERGRINNYGSPIQKTNSTFNLNQMLSPPSNTSAPNSPSPQTRNLSAPLPQSRPQSQSPVRTNVRMMNPGAIMSQDSLNKDLPPIAQKISIPRYMTEGDISSFRNPNSPIRNTHNQILQIEKRSFSDESKVSSVSSFSTVTDAISFSSKLQHEIKQRNFSGESVESDGSTLSNGSNESWDSVQKSIDLTIRESDLESGDNYSEEPDSEVSEQILDSPIEFKEQIVHKSVAHIPVITDSDNIEHSREVAFEEANATIDTEAGESGIADYYLNMNESEDETELEEEQEIPEPQVLKDVRQESEWESTSDSADESQETIEFQTNGVEEKEVNVGVGKKFDFPNNLNNITNSDITKKRIISSETFKSGKSHFSYFSAIDGQIEIPDLSEASFSEAGTIRREAYMSVNGTRFNDLVSDSESEQLEPIGIPSQKGRRVVTEQFKHLYGSDDDDSDIGSTNYSLYSNAVKSKSTSNLLSDKKLPPIPSDNEMIRNQIQTPMRQNISHNRSHSRHNRNKSLGKIEFNLADLQKPIEKAQPLEQSRPMEQARPIEQAKQQAKPIEHTLPRGIESKEQPKQSSEPITPVDDQFNIKVNDPPMPIDYKVDFKEAAKVRNEFRSMTPTMNELRKVKSKKVPSKKSDTSESSYVTSRSGKQSDTTDLSDTESVMIDLTKEKYDVYTIQRNNSTQSYRSVTESFGGKEVEVVLVDDDERDLESIYSKYGKNWLGRSESTRSDRSSTSSSFSYTSMASQGQINVKGPITPVRSYNLKKTSSINSTTSSKYNSRRIKLPKKVEEVEEEEKYFDYTKSTSFYDFNTFINEKNKIGQ